MKYFRFLILALTALFFAGTLNAASVENNAKEKFEAGVILLKKLEGSLKNQENSFTGVRKNTAELKLRLKNSYQKIQTLKGQLQNIQQNIKNTNQKLLSIRRQIAERKNELILLKSAFEKKQQEREKLQVLLASYEASPVILDEFEILLAFASIGENLQNQYYMSLAKSALLQMAEDLDRNEKELLLTKKKLDEKKQAFEYLQTRLSSELRNLQYHKESKARLLAETKGKEEIYKELIEQSKKEEEEVARVIGHLKDNYKFIEEKLNDLKESEDLEGISIEDLEDAVRNLPIKTDAKFIWPVSPIRGISAYFRDSAYQKTMGIPHNAIDIRIPQETPVKAALAGVVYKVRDEDSGYNYVILAHRNGLLTLYGHLTKINVKENETVFTGETIGLSGGIPGSRGAGWLTTGAHLHFEVFQDWKHVDPLEFLAVEFLPIEYVPQKYLSKLTGPMEKKIMRVKPKKVSRVGLKTGLE